MSRKNTFLSLLLVILLFSACKQNDVPKKTVVAAPVAFKQEAEAYLTKTSGDTIQHLKLEIADNDYERETGLMYRQAMDQDQGMLFIFEQEEPRGFYMKNTHIPLDLIFLNAQRKIVSISKNAQPESLETIPSNLPAQYVLEINGGLSDQWNLETGDSLILNRD
ncbi:DUF192 domain-containing protein [Salinimicrobium oceani]|uniref:DUF192 domain-containing protein n=1 Tax=Salinimicrobium oceani TaxID=2722702 RepID=A0ABX1D139_9FLAO|nr:DUF192 domain-containing protein [Salinimicrobium oceani]NJW53782.1 DUF192 domain-containing protein [Salinimicrobium oceani]